MLFNSSIFIFVFLPVTFFIYFYLNNKRLTEASKAFLVFASLFFYSWWNIVYLPIILVSMLFNYVVGINLSEEKAHQKLDKKLMLSIGIVANLSLLGYFKYADFLIENINILSKGNMPLLHLALPLAISFFTFQQIAYLVDSYRGETKEYDFLNYANFVTFFPQLIAGPIVHHSEMMPQFSKTKNKVKNYNNIALGLFIFSIGLFKKVAIADSFAVWATAGFDVAPTLNFYEAWATSLSYTFQLYFDFSGYTDMAIGSALLFNIKLPINFDSPYKAISIQDFWRRWHITLSRFLRDYIYIPLGGNRKSQFRTYSNLMGTFIIGGIWHGAGWPFIFWGFLHGIALIIQRVWTQLGIKLWNWLAWFLTFNFVNIAWVFFRAKEWDDAMKVLHGMFHILLPKEIEPYVPFISSVKFISFSNITPHLVDNNVFIYLAIGLFIILFLSNTNKYMSKTISARLMIFAAIIFSYSIIRSLTSSTEVFLYFNF